MMSWSKKKIADGVKGKKVFQFHLRNMLDPYATNLISFDNQSLIKFSRFSIIKLKFNR